MILSRATTSAQIATTRGARAPSWPPWRVCARARQRQRFHRREERWRCVDVSRWNAALLSAVLWPDYTRAFVTASARSGRRRAPHSAGRLLLPAVDNQSIRLDWQSNRPIHGNATQPRPTSCIYLDEFLRCRVRCCLLFYFIEIFINLYRKVG
ncbi:Inactive cell surface hyaluronidase CEMIP2 [Trichinella pseudospiralis]